MDRRRTRDEAAERVGRIGWWALAAAAAVHGILLLGMRVPREGQTGWLARRVLIWETQPRRLTTSAAEATRIAGIHRMISRETPPADMFSKHVLLLAQRTPAMAVVASILYLHGARGSEAPQEPRMRKGNALVWQIEAEGELAEAVKRVWQQGAAVQVPANYAPQAPVVLEVTARGGGTAASVVIAHSSGDMAFDEAARKMVASLRLVVVRQGRPDEVWKHERLRARVMVTIEPED